MRSEPARLSAISLDFAGIPPKLDENFPYETRKWARLSR